MSEVPEGAGIRSEGPSVSSREWSDRAQRVLPSGVTHDMRFLRPSPVYIHRAHGPHKWDVDGNRYVDFWMGHGSLLLGHTHPDVIEAVQETVGRVTHAGGCHPLEVEWAELVVEMVPSAERVRFTASGTEATMLALRLARAARGLERVLKFEGHFHGWHDYATYGVNPPFERPTSLGVPAAVGSTVTVVPADLERVRSELSKGDVAGIILEPTGASMGLVPIDPAFLAGIRMLCDETGALLIFDEVITGFRYAPGGVQQLTGILPDLTVLGKVLAGGMPGGAVAGRSSLMDLIAFRGEPEADRFDRVPHTGTFNANPASAAAGVATLRLVQDGEDGERASKLAAMLREGLAEVVERRGAGWSIMGEASVFHWLPIAPEDLAEGALGGSDFTNQAEQRKAARGPTSAERMRTALLRRGVDFPGYEGWLSSTHTEADIEATVHAFSDGLEEVGP